MKYFICWTADLKSSNLWSKQLPIEAWNSQGPVSRKPRKLFGPEKPFVKLWPAYSVNLVFSYVVKGIKNKNNCKVSCLETPSFWRYKENSVTRNAPEKFRNFREQAPGHLRVKPVTSRYRCDATNQLSYEATDVGSWTPLKSWLFQASIRNCLNWVHNCDDHSLLD